MSNARLEIGKNSHFYNVVVDYFGKDNPHNIYLIYFDLSFLEDVEEYR